MASMKTTSPIQSHSDSKPIKLRSACNSCFSAKVRCDGNKEGCSRCAEKRLECTFSESRVGKVVGKRRKRAIPCPLNTSALTDLQPIHQSLSGLPSPASTYSSDGSGKRSCSDSSWMSFIAYDDPSTIDFSDCRLDSPTFDMLSTTTFAMGNEAPFQINTGLQTPSVSPTETRFLSPTDLEARPEHRQVSRATPVHMFVQPTIPASASKTPEPHPDDEETVCIKLLAHLKKHISPTVTNVEAQLTLLNKTNATVQRLLQSRTVRSDYTCQLLLSSILAYQVDLIERTCRQQLQHNSGCPEAGFRYDHGPSTPTRAVHFEQSHQPGTLPSQREALVLAVKETATVCSGVGDLLKRKPFNGFQTLGKHESHHIKLDHRLRKTLAALS